MAPSVVQCETSEQEKHWHWQVHLLIHLTKQMQVKVHTVNYLYVCVCSCVEENQEEEKRKVRSSPFFHRLVTSWSSYRSKKRNWLLRMQGRGEEKKSRKNLSDPLVKVTVGAACSTFFLSFFLSLSLSLSVASFIVPASLFHSLFFISLSLPFSPLSCTANGSDL